MRKRLRPVGSLPLVDVLAIRQIDLDKRRPIEAVAYGCTTRCHSRDHVNRLAVAARFGHLMGVSFTAGEIAYWGKWADAAMGKLEPR